ncbi:NADPH-dependent FMN reductase [Lutibacter sp.]|uniref:NADPH-dependent FMN reductase n=1 Tax=Lutibacter sp. TaxID=1925666 RepID=UPI002735BD87|nr:NAD(P)H-dependent oxidoreductase [Lutibacter sp.]MDP3313997.1 NAD(P)H-dependent oxidoreductase [Lutibacter sp.]
MKKIITIGGSNSKNSINKILAEYVGDLVKNVELIKVDLNNYEMPLFSVDVEAKVGSPKGVIALNELIETADGFIISLAEHNGSYSVAFKNAFDWLSRINGKVWRDKPMLLLATSPGIRGGQSVLDIALGRFPFNGAQIVGSMSFPSFFDNFKNNEVLNEELKMTIEKLVADLEKKI